MTFYYSREEFQGHDVQMFKMCRKFAFYKKFKPLSPHILRKTHKDAMLIRAKVCVCVCVNESNI